MAELTEFILGTLHNDFLEMKTSDDIYLKDLILKDIGPSLELYNNEVLQLTKLLAYKFDDSVANNKKMYHSDTFEEVSDIEMAANKAQFDAWNRPIPITRYAAGTTMTLEVMKQMSSQQIIKWHNAKLFADSKNIIRKMFENGITKTPSAKVDALTHKSATPKAFWNDESGMDTPRANGQITFDGDHQHYLAVASGGSIGTNGSELDTLISRITEHEGMSGQICLWARTGTTLNLITNESTNFRSYNLTSPLLPNAGEQYMESGIAQALVRAKSTLGFNINIVGTWKEALVIETPDIPAGYILATMFVDENSDLAPMGWREHPQFKGLWIVEPNGGNPFIGKDAQYRRYLGLHVWNRDAGAVLYTTGTSWVEPTFV